MCDLLCLSFNQPVDLRISFDNFAFKDRRNKSGWGVAWFDGGSHVVKDFQRASESPKADSFTSKKPKSTVFISHVRAASCGRDSMENTHPFERSYCGKDYVFAHNGTVQFTPKSAGQFEPEGETDSESLFCEILNEMSRSEIDKLDHSNFEWLQNLLCELNDGGNMNIAFSDGELLFCYCDDNNYNGFSYIHRKAPFETIKLLDKSESQNEDCFVELAKEKHPSQEGYLIATTERTGKPTDEPWQLLPAGSLTVFANGKLVFGNLK